MPTSDRHQTDNPTVDLEPYKREFGRALQVSRLAAGLTQAAQAKAWGYNRSTIANCENGSQVSRPIYQLAKHQYPDLPTIPEWEEGSDFESSPEEQHSGVTEFEQMLLDRTRSRDALLGTWHALWQTEVEGKELFNSEILEFRPMLRKRVMITNPRSSFENPVGGYAWKAECRFFDNDSLLGVYASIDDANFSKGALQMKIHVSGKYIDGQWIGEGYDGTFSRGHAVFCRNREMLVARMRLLIDRDIDFQFRDVQNEERKYTL